MPKKSLDKKKTSKHTTKAPCSKNCYCYLTQAVNDLKQIMAMRYEALTSTRRAPTLSAKLTPSQRRLLPPSREPPSFITCVSVRELAAREHDLEDVTADQARVASELDRFTALGDVLNERLVEVKAALKSVDSAIGGCPEDDEEELDGEKVAQATKIVEDSQSRRRRMKEILDSVEAHCRSEEEALFRLHELFKDRELNRAALQSALRAVKKLVCAIRGRERTCDETSTALTP